MMEGRETDIIVAPSRGSLPGDGTASFRTVFVRACSPRRIPRAESAASSRSAHHPGFAACPPKPEGRRGRAKSGEKVLILPTLVYAQDGAPEEEYRLAA